MGLFSRKCDKCGASVKKQARFCNKCGDSAPKSWVKCASCNKWVGVESKNCSHCKVSLRPEERESIVDERLILPQNLFMQRIDVANINTRNDALVIEPGQMAIAMQDAKIGGVLKNGRHSIKDGFLKSLIFGDRKEKQVLFIANSAEFVLPLSGNDYRTQEDLSLNIYTELLVKINEKETERVVVDLAQSKRQVSYEDIITEIKYEVEKQLKLIVGEYSADELMKDANAILSFDNKLSDYLTKIMSRIGLKVIRVAATQFSGKELNQLRAKSGDAELLAREIVLKQRTKELLDDETMANFKSDEDLKMYMLQISHENGVSEEKIKHEMTTLQKVHSHEIEIKDFEHSLNLAKIKETQELDSTRKWMEIRKEKNDAKREDVSENLKLYANYTPAQLAAVLPADQVDAIIKARQLEMLEKQQEMQKDMTPEQILAINSANSQHSAQALAAIGQEKIKAAEEKAKMASENSDRMEKIMEKALDANAQVANCKNNDVTIMK